MNNSASKARRPSTVSLASRLGRPVCSTMWSSCWGWCKWPRRKPSSRLRSSMIAPLGRTENWPQRLDFLGEGYPAGRKQMVDGWQFWGVFWSRKKQAKMVTTTCRESSTSCFSAAPWKCPVVESGEANDEIDDLCVTGEKHLKWKQDTQVKYIKEILSDRSDAICWYIHIYIYHYISIVHICRLCWVMLSHSCISSSLQFCSCGRSMVWTSFDLWLFFFLLLLVILQWTILLSPSQNPFATDQLSVLLGPGCDLRFGRQLCWDTLCLTVWPIKPSLKPGQKTPAAVLVISYGSVGLHQLQSIQHFAALVKEWNRARPAK